MAKNTSDQAGRALEYIIVEELLQQFPQITPVGCTLTDQNRDQQKFLTLDLNQRNYYLKSTTAIIIWLEEKFSISQATSIQLERLPDSAAKKGNVTDIHMNIDGMQINLSLKHNHTALKHQRPASTAVRCGYEKKSCQDVEYRRRHAEIGANFLRLVKGIDPNITMFDQIKRIDPLLIDNQLYQPVCENITSFLNTHANDSPFAQCYFTFLTGNTNYYKIVVYRNSVEIMEFADMPPVESLKAEQPNNSYVNVVFSNGWKISMRLHTASSRIHGLSLKFDTQPIEISIPKEIIAID